MLTSTPLLLSLASLLPLVSAHGYTFFPTSRGEVVWPNPSPAHYTNPRGYPVSQRGDPWALPAVPATQQTRLAPGPLTIVYGFGEGANHVGPCSAFLRSASDPSINVQIGYKENCAQDLYDASVVAFQASGITPAYLPATLPSGYDYLTDPIIYTVLEAHHVGPPYEMYEDVHDFVWDAASTNQIPSDLYNYVMPGQSLPADAYAGYADSQYAAPVHAAVVPPAQSSSESSSTSPAAAANTYDAPAPAPASSYVEGNEWDTETYGAPDTETVLTVDIAHKQVVDSTAAPTTTTQYAPQETTSASPQLPASADVLAPAPAPAEVSAPVPAPAPADVPSPASADVPAPAPADIPAPAPPPADSYNGSIDIASWQACWSEWSACNEAWQNGAGTVGPNECQARYGQCQNKAMHVHRRRLNMRIVRRSHR